MCLAQGHNTVPVGSNTEPLDSESNALLLGHCAPQSYPISSVMQRPNSAIIYMLLMLIN